MLNRNRAGLFIFALGVFFCAAPSALFSQTTKWPSAYDKGWMLRKTITLWPKINGIDGRLELFTDTRVRPDMTNAESSEFLPAKIRVLRIDGKVTQKKTLERSRATLETAPPLYGTKTARPTYLLTVDYSADMGSYNGPITFLLEVTNGKLLYASVQSKPISLMRSLKTDWKFVPEKSGQGKTTDILEVACRPNAAAKLSDDNMDNDFVVMYRRFHFDGNRWTKREKSRVGFWEDDGHFPPASLFPAPVL